MWSRATTAAEADTAPRTSQLQRLCVLDVWRVGIDAAAARRLAPISLEGGTLATDGAAKFTYEMLVSFMAPSPRKTSVAGSKPPTAAVDIGSEKLQVVLVPGAATLADHELVRPGTEVMACIQRIEDAAPAHRAASATLSLVQRWLYVVVSMKPVGFIRSYALASASERRLWARSVCRNSALQGASPSLLAIHRPWYAFFVAPRVVSV